MKHCFYRMQGSNLKCFAGALIPDAEYKPYFECKSFGFLVIDGVWNTPTAHKYASVTIFVEALQSIHDVQSLAGWDNEEVERKLEAFASRYSLEYKPVSS